MNELVSVGLLTYNHEQYVSDAIKGLLSQDYENIELVLLDDASTDRTNDLIDGFMEALSRRFVRVQRISHKSNTGNISYNVNRLIEAATGCFVHIIAGDDIMLSKCIGTLVSALKKNTDCIMAFGNMQFIDEHFSYGTVLERPTLFHPADVPSGKMPNNVFEGLMIHGNVISAPAAMCRADAFTRHGLHDESILVEDYEYWLRLSVEESFYYVNEPLVYYRRSSGSFTVFTPETKKEKLDAMMDADYRTKKKYLDLLPKDKQKKAMCAYIKNYVTHCLNAGYQEGVEKLYDIMAVEGISIDDLE